MTCYECAYLEIERNEVVGMIEVCKHPEKYIPPAGFAYKEHDCKFFKKKSGISKWDSYSDEEKAQVLKHFREKYAENPIGDLTCEQAEASYIGYLKETDSNAKSETKI